MTDDWKSKYDSVGLFHEGLAYVQLGDDKTGKWGFVNTQGKEVIPLKYDNAGFFSEGLAIVKLNGKIGYVDKEGNEYWDMTADAARRQMRNR